MEADLPDRGAHAGAGGAFAAFVEAQRAPLARFLRAQRVPDADVPDLAQDVLVRLLRYRDREQPSAWTALMYRIAIHLVMDRAKGEARARENLARTRHDEEPVSPSPESEALGRERVERLRTAILGLPPRCRDVYVLQRVEELTYSQIARRLGISVKAVEKQMSRALRAMRAAESAGGED